MEIGVGRGLAVLVVLAMLVGACSSGRQRLPPPSVTSSTAVVTTSIPDFSDVALPTIEGTTTTTLATSGSSTIRGTVTVPEGGVPGATVRLERLVMGAVQIRDVVADDAGAYTATNIPGGAYRVRAFLAPSVAQLEPVTFRLSKGEVREANLVARVFAGQDVATVVSPSSPHLDEPVNVRVRVSEQVVDGDGVVRATPINGLAVKLINGRWAPLQAGGVERVTDNAGAVLFELQCNQVGPPELVVQIETFPDPVDLTAPNCTVRPPPTTTTTTTTAPTETTNAPPSSQPPVTSPG